MISQTTTVKSVSPNGGDAFVRCAQKYPQLSLPIRVKYHLVIPPQLFKEGGGPIEIPFPALGRQGTRDDVADGSLPVDRVEQCFLSRTDKKNQIFVGVSAID